MDSEQSSDLDKSQELKNIADTTVLASNDLAKNKSTVTKKVTDS